MKEFLLSWFPFYVSKFRLICADTLVIENTHCCRHQWISDAQCHKLQSNAYRQTLIKSISTVCVQHVLSEKHKNRPPLISELVKQTNTVAYTHRAHLMRGCQLLWHSLWTMSAFVVIASWFKTENSSKHVCQHPVPTLQEDFITSTHGKSSTKQTTFPFLFLQCSSQFRLPRPSVAVR